MVFVRGSAHTPLGSLRRSLRLQSDGKGTPPPHTPVPRRLRRLDLSSYIQPSVLAYHF